MRLKAIISSLSDIKHEQQQILPTPGKQKCVTYLYYDHIHMYHAITLTLYWPWERGARWRSSCHFRTSLALRSGTPQTSCTQWCWWYAWLGWVTSVTWRSEPQSMSYDRVYTRTRVTNTTTECAESLYQNALLRSTDMTRVLQRLSDNTHWSTWGNQYSYGMVHCLWNRALTIQKSFNYTMHIHVENKSSMIQSE